MLRGIRSDTILVKKQLFNIISLQKMQKKNHSLIVIFYES